MLLTSYWSIETIEPKENLIKLINLVKTKKDAQLIKKAIAQKILKIEKTRGRNFYFKKAGFSKEEKADAMKTRRKDQNRINKQKSRARQKLSKPKKQKIN